MIAGHRKLCTLLLNQEVVQFFLLWKLVTESDTIVVHTETDKYLALSRWLIQGYCQLVVVVANVLGLAPYRLPGFIEGRCFFLGNSKTVHQVGLVLKLGCVAIFCQFQSEVRRLDNCTPLKGHLINRASCVVNSEFYLDIAVRRFYIASDGHEWQQRQR